MSAAKIAHALLSKDADVLALTGGRVYVLRRPQNSLLPAITVTTIYEGEDQLLAGASHWYEARVAVSCLAAGAIAADELGEAVKACLGDVIEAVVSTTESPPVLLGTATTWKTGADVMDWSDDHSVTRRLIDFVVRWRR